MVSRETEEKIRKLAAIDKKIADSSWLFYLSGEGEERKSADELIDMLVFQKLKKDYEEKIFLKSAPPPVCNGSYFLGMVLYPAGKHYCPFGLREDEWVKHLLITGMTGAGKTNLVFHILKELKKKNKPFMVFDWKRNYRDLLQLPEFKDLLVFTIGKQVTPFHFNPLLPPPGTEPGEWLMKLVDVLKHAYFVGEGVEYVLREAIDRVYEHCGFYDITKTETPTFYMVRDYVHKKKMQGRMSLWKTSAMRVLESLCFRHGLGSVVNGDTAWAHAQLLHSPIILELDLLSDSDKIFFVEAMILWLYEFRKNEGKREEFKHALLIEEAHHILSRAKESLEGAETIIETSLRQIREFGEAVIVIDQEPSKLSNSIKANTYCKITFNLGNGDDMKDIASCIALTEEESGYIDLLDVGHAIVSLKGRIHVPLHVVFPKIDIRKGLVTNDDLKGSLLNKKTEEKIIEEQKEIPNLNDIWRKLR